MLHYSENVSDSPLGKLLSTLLSTCSWYKPFSDPQITELIVREETAGSALLATANLEVLAVSVFVDACGDEVIDSTIACRS